MLKKIMKYGEAEVMYKTKKALAEKPVLYNLFWETTLRCNAKCKHCGSRAGENLNLRDELTTDEIEQALKSIADKYDSSKILLNITGGEPLVREDLFEVMRFATDLGFNWGMTTNGILIDDDIIKKMIDTKMTTISISLDGLQKSHDEFRGVNGAFKKTVEGIKKLKQANFLNILQVTTVINKLNIEELDDLYEFIKMLHLDSWRVVNMDPIGRAMDNSDLALGKDEYLKLINFIKDNRKKSKMDITYGCSHYLGLKYEKEVRNNMFFCFTGFNTASILYNGDIFVCPNVERRPELIQGNIRKDDFVDVWENKFKWFRDENKLKCEKCSKCEEWKYCLGDSVHTWDFENKRPKICLNEILNNK